jgi:hypothetical protein
MFGIVGQFIESRARETAELNGDIWLEAPLRAQCDRKAWVKLHDTPGWANLHLRKNTRNSYILGLGAT